MGVGLLRDGGGAVVGMSWSSPSSSSKSSSIDLPDGRSSGSGSGKTGERGLVGAAMVLWKARLLVFIRKLEDLIAGILAVVVVVVVVGVGERTVDVRVLSSRSRCRCV